MTERYEPPEKDIKRVLEKCASDPRKLAIAYLRARKKFQDTDTALKVMSGIQDLTLAAATGDVELAEKGFRDAKLAVNTHKSATS